MADFLPDDPLLDWQPWIRVNTVSVAGGIHLWKARLSEWAASANNFYTSLSEAEKERARRFHIKGLRERFSIAHGILRNVLSVYLDLPAAAIQFNTLSSGKPVLAGESRARNPGLKFNLSHSEDLLILAVSQEPEVGVDVEWIETGHDHSAISRHFFAAEELHWLQSMAPELQGNVFYKLWTCKEAVLKASGSGLRQNLDSVKIEPGPGEKLDRSQLLAGKIGRETWEIFTFEPEAGYIAALAYKMVASAATKPKIKFFKWTG